MLEGVRDVIGGNVRVMLLVAVLSGAYGAMVEVVTQPLMLDLGASMALIGLLIGLGGFDSIIPTLVQPIAGALSDLKGRRPFLLLSRLMMLCSLSSYLAAEILMGLSAGAWDPAIRTYLSKVARVDDIGGSMGRLSAFRGMVGFAAPAAGGVLYDHLRLIGPLLPTMIGSLGIALGMAAVLLKEV